jgi:uncharacterized delta-60 repeat protein
MKHLWLVPALIVTFIACTTPSTVPTVTVSGKPTQKTNPKPGIKPIGLLEVTLDFSDEQKPLGVANFKPIGSSKPGLNTQAISANGNESSRIKLSRNSVGFIDANETFGTKTRYVRGTFDIANFSPRAFNNLNFMAVSSGSTKLGTMFASLKDAAEVVIPDSDQVSPGVLTYRALKPTHGMRSDGTGVVVDPKLANMQVFTASEASSVQSALTSTYPGIQVLEYGYTARANNGGRAIPVTPTSAACSSTLVSGSTYSFVTNNASCFTGTVTFAFKFPRKVLRSQNPLVFSFAFVVSDESETNYTQSLEEQSAGTIAGLSITEFPAPIQNPRILLGTLVDDTANSLPICGGVKTAVSTAALNTDDFLTAFPNLTILHNSLDLCGFGIFGKRTLSNAQDIYLKPDGKIWALEGQITSYQSNGKKDPDVAYKLRPKLKNIYLRSNGDIGVSGVGYDGGVLLGLLDGYNSVCTVLPSAIPNDYSIQNCSIFGIEPLLLAFPHTLNTTVLQPDGGIVLMGAITDPSNPGTQNNIAYAHRYSATGSPDTGFAGSGAIQSSILAGPLSKGLAVQSDGKILIAGHKDVSPQPRFTDFAIARYNSNGTADSSFGTAGIVTSTIVAAGLTAGINNKAFDLSIQPDGKIIAVGTSNGLPAVARFLSSGAPDLTFGFFGTYLADGISGLTAGAANTVELKADGKIMLAGNATFNGKNGAALIRLNTNGTPDSSFGTGGLGFLDLGNLDPVNTFKFQPDGKILVSTASYIARYIP